jgi:UDP-2-acetamido-3-amino-2,3-dideoxy-glucuronate N-acetyltransferase
MEKQKTLKPIQNEKSFFLHPLAAVDNGVVIGNGTRVWQFVVILKGAKIGDDCNICANCFVENQGVIGSRVTIKSGVQVWNGVELKDDTFVGPNVTFANDLYPRSRKWSDHPKKTIVENGASIGANCTILPGITIGKHAMVGAGSVVTKHVPAYAIVCGNPARMCGWICICGIKLNTQTAKNIACKCGLQYKFSNGKLSSIGSSQVRRPKNNERQY